MSVQASSERNPLDAERIAKLQSIDDGKDATSVLQEILVTLRKSTIIPRDGETKWVRFWNKYTHEADEYDKEFLERYKNDMNNTMIFSGLLTAGLATFASMTISGLSQDPNVITQALLQNMLVVLTALNGTAEPLPQTVTVPTWDGPIVSVIWFQTLLYTSLVCSLMVALGAVLASQWLSRYNAVEERGTVEDRGKKRQQKFDGLQAWKFRAFLEALPILLQFSLLLFGVSLCAFMWAQQRIIASVLIGANGLGGLLWVYTVVVSTIYPDSPYDTPLSDFLARRIATKGLKKPRQPVDASPFMRFVEWLKTTQKLISTSLSALLHPFRQWIRRHRPESDMESNPSSSMDSLITSPTPQNPAIIESLCKHSTVVWNHVTPPIRRFLTPVSWVSRHLYSHVLAPVVVAHHERLARSDPTPNDVQRAAIAWLLKTSTDPEVHTNALLVAREIIWTDGMLTQWTSVKMLDLILDQLLACFHADNSLREDSVDKLVSLCSSFLLVYWHLYHHDLDRTFAWARGSGLAFIRAHKLVMTTLLSMKLPGISHSLEGPWALRHAYLSFQHITEIIAPHTLVGIEFPTSTVCPLSSSSFTAPLRLRTSSLIKLSQISYADKWSSSNRTALFTQVEKYVSQDAPRTPYLALLPAAMLLGFRMDTTDTIDCSNNVGWPHAAKYILDEVEHHLQWRVHDDDWLGRPRIAYVLNYRSVNYLGPKAIAMLLRILRVLHSTTQALPASWAAPFPHFLWLTEYIPRICLCSDVHLEVVCQCVVDAITAFSHMDNISSWAKHGSLRSALDAVAQLKAGDYLHNPSASIAFVRMQHTTLSFINSLVTKGIFRDTTIPTFSSLLCNWDLSQPQSSKDLTTLPEEERKLIEERDTMFMKLLVASAAGVEDTPPRAWLNDPINDKLIRVWLFIAHRWLVPHQPFSSEKEFKFSIRSLFECDRVRRPDVSYWGEDLFRVQQIAVVALWDAWFLRLVDVDHGAPAEFGELVKNTLFILKIDTQVAVDVEWHIDGILAYLKSFLPGIRRPLDPSLEWVQSALESKSDGIKALKNQIESSSGESTYYLAK